MNISNSSCEDFVWRHGSVDHVCDAESGVMHTFHTDQHDLTLHSNELSVPYCDTVHNCTHAGEEGAADRSRSRLHQTPTATYLPLAVCHSAARACLCARLSTYSKAAVLALYQAKQVATSNHMRETDQLVN